VNLYSTLQCTTWSVKHSDMALCNKEITQFYLPHTHEPYLPLLPSCKVSLPLGWYQLILLGEQRHIGVRNLPRVSTPHARPRVEPTTSWSQVRYSTDSATMPHVTVCWAVWQFSILKAFKWELKTASVMEHCPALLWLFLSSWFCLKMCEFTYLLFQLCDDSCCCRCVR